MNEATTKQGTFFTPVRTVRISAVIILVICTLMSLGAIAKNAANKARCTEKVEAVVIGYVTSEGDSGETYAPLFSYSYGGTNFRSADNVYTNPPSYKKGETVQIFIDPDNPHRIYVSSEKVTYIMVAVFMGVGLIEFVVFFFIAPIFLRPKEILVSYVDRSAGM